VQPRKVLVVDDSAGSAEDAARGLQAGAAAYSRKPFHSEEILDMITSLPNGHAA